MQALGSPSAEAGSHLRLHTITESNNHVEVIMSDLSCLCFAFDCTMLSGYSEIPNNHYLVKFSILKYMLNMFTYI